MPINDIFGLLKNKVRIILLSGLFFSAFTFLFLVISQEKFKSTASLLVVQNQQGFSDYYALSRSADYLTNILIESIYSEKFLEEMNNTNIVSSPFLPNNKLERLKEWNRIVRVNKNSNLGIINIEVFGNNRVQATEISNAVISVLTSRNFVFLGKGQDIDVRVLNGPIWEKNPSLGNIASAVSGGFVVGIILAFMILFFREEKRQNESRKILEKIKKENREIQEQDRIESLRYMEP